MHILLTNKKNDSMVPNRIVENSVYTIKGYVTIYYTTVDVAGTTCRRLTKVSKTPTGTT